MPGPDVRVRDTETGAEYFVSEARFKNPPKKGLWERLDQGKPRTTVAAAAAKKTAKKAASAKKTTATKKAAKRTVPSPQADDNKETS